MPSPFDNFVFYITSNDPGNSHHGTGFLIHTDELFAYVLTCRHVLDDIGGVDHARIASYPVKEAITLSQDSPDDFVVLTSARTHFSESRPLGLSPCHADGKAFMVIGYYLHERKSRKLKSGQLPIIFRVR